MWIHRRYLLSVAIRAVALVSLALVGCRAQPVKWSELGRDDSGAGARSSSARTGSTALLRIEPLSNQEVADLSPDDVVRIAWQIGFTNQQVIDLGLDLRNALALSGGAQVLYKDKTEALLRVQGGYVLIHSASRGRHVYNLSLGRFDPVGLQ